MTIRESLAKRKRVWLIALLTLGAIAMLGPIIGREALPTWAFRVSFFSALGFLLCFMPWSFFALRCPRCKSYLDINSRIGKKTRFFRSNPINYCPYCGVSLDEPVEH